MEQLYELLDKCCPTIDFRQGTRLITEKIIDSLDLVAIVFAIENEFDIEIDVSEIDIESFESADKIWELIQNIKKN